MLVAGSICCGLPLLGLGGVWLWARSRAFAVLAGTLTLVALACVTGIATVWVVPDVVRADRLVGVAQQSECVPPGSHVHLGATSYAGVQTISASPLLAAAAGLPPGGDAPWPVTLRTRSGRSGRYTIGTYPTDPERRGAVSSESNGEIGSNELVFVAIRVDPAEVLRGSPVEVRAETVVAHETIEVEWFWMMDDALVIHDDAEGGTIEVRDLDLALRARATGVGSLDRPIDWLLVDSRGGAYFAVQGPPLVIAHVTAEGEWARTEISSLGAVGALSEARHGGVCVWPDRNDGIVRVDGAPFAERAWPIAVVLLDRIVELTLLAIAWSVCLLALGRIAILARPWWALRRGRARVGEVRDAHTDRATWSESGHVEHGLRAAAWLGFATSTPTRPEPAVAIDAVVAPSHRAYREPARDELHARWVVRGTSDEAARFLEARVVAVLSPIGLVGLILATATATIVALVRALGS